LAAKGNSGGGTTVKPGEQIVFTPLNAQGVADATKAVKAQYNPASITYSESANYSEDTVPHGGVQSKGNTLWNSTNAPRWGFTIFLDDFSIEGVADQQAAISNPASVMTSTVTKKVKALKKLLLTVNGETHEPNSIEVTFGSIVFRGNCKSMKTQYKGFDIAGNANSAEVTLEFLELPSSQTLVSETDLQSPDVTHSVSVDEGDHLTGISIKMYGTPAYFTQIAKVNNLDSIRGIAPGTILYLPPLEKI
jgi:nucleoid-associated protein YgaU